MMIRMAAGRKEDFAAWDDGKAGLIVMISGRFCCNGTCPG